MLVDNSVYRNAYDAPGNVRTFTISFPFLDASHIAVYQKIGEAEDVKVPASQYTISGAGDPRGGTLTMNTAPAAGTKIVILRDIPITQLYNYAELDNFPAESHENALAKLTMICQQLKEVLNRNLTVPATSSKKPDELLAEIFVAQRESIEFAARAASSAAAASASKQGAASSAAAASASEQGAASYLTQTQQTKTEAVAAIQAQQSASESAVEEAGDVQAVRLEQLASAILVYGMGYNKEATVTLDRPITAGTVVSLPVANDGQQMIYRVGASTLRLGFNGTLLFEGEQFEEVGNAGSLSASVKLLFDAETGDVLNFFVYSQNVMVAVDETSGLSIDDQKRLSAAALRNLIVDIRGEVEAAKKNSVPVGTVIAFAANSEPPGDFLLCNGAAVSRTTYAALFSVVGTTFDDDGDDGDDGDGSTTFHLPDLVNARFIEGSYFAGTYHNPGLPNLTGTVHNVPVTSLVYDGVFAESNGTPANIAIASSDMYKRVTIDFNANRSNTIYGASNTVQPNALTMRFYIKY